MFVADCPRWTAHRIDRLQAEIKALTDCRADSRSVGHGVARRLTATFLDEEAGGRSRPPRARPEPTRSGSGGP